MTEAAAKPIDLMEALKTALQPKTPTLHLYDHADALDVVREWLLEPDNQEALAQAGGDLDALPALKELLDGAEMDFKKKAENVGLVIRDRTLTAKAIGEEIDRLKQLQKAASSAADSLKAYLKYNLERVGMTRVDGKLCVVTLAKNSQPAVLLTVPDAEQAYQLDEAARAYISREEKIVYALDRDRILAAWKAKEPLPAVIVVEQGHHVRIR